MELTTTIDKEKNLRIHTITGPLSKEALFPALLEMYASAGFDPDMNALWDVRRAEMGSIVMSDVIETCAFVRNQWENGKPIRVAFLVNSDVDFTLATMYETLSEDNAKFEIRIFRDFEKSMDWVTG